MSKEENKIVPDNSFNDISLGIIKQDLDESPRQIVRNSNNNWFKQNDKKQVEIKEGLKNNFKNPL